MLVSAVVLELGKLVSAVVPELGMLVSAVVLELGMLVLVVVLELDRQVVFVVQRCSAAAEAPGHTQSRAGSRTPSPPPCRRTGHWRWRTPGPALSGTAAPGSPCTAAGSPCRTRSGKPPHSPCCTPAQ